MGPHAKKLLALLLLTGSFGCSGGSNEPTTATGLWMSGVWRMTLLQDGGVVTGSGQAPYVNPLTSNPPLTAISVNGTADGSTFSFTFTAPGFPNVNFAGAVSGSYLSGRLNGGGLVNQPITFSRQ
jgi:hypothetical protein